MFDYRNHFARYRKEQQIDLALSFNMPAGYETANGTFDAESKTVFVNAEQLKEAPDYEKAFYLFHELRHASQYLCPDRFSREIARSIQYVILYDGTCFRMINGKYRECRLEGSEEYLANLYLGQPHEIDANTYAYEQAGKICGESEGLRKLYEFWIPRQPVLSTLYDSVYDEIDEKTQ